MALSSHWFVSEMTWRFCLKLRGSLPPKGSYIIQDLVCSHAIFLTLLQNMCSPAYLKEKNHIFLLVVQASKSVLCILPDHHERRKISGILLGTPRIMMFPMVHTVIYIAGFHLLLFWRTVILCWLALKYLAIVPCLCGNISWIRIQSLCSLLVKLCSNRNVILPLITVNRNTTMTELSWIYMWYSISCITKSTVLKISIECQWF